MSSGVGVDPVRQLAGSGGFLDRPFAVARLLQMSGGQDPGQHLVGQRVLRTDPDQLREPLDREVETAAAASRHLLVRYKQVHISDRGGSPD